MNRNGEDLSLAERRAFAQLAQYVGFAPQVTFGRGNKAKVLRYLPNANVLYALARFENPNAHAHGIWEYRLFVAFPGGKVTAEADEEVLVGERKGPKAAPKNGTVDRSSPAFIRKLRRAQKKAWVARRKKYGPRGFSEGKEPWKKAGAVYNKQRAEAKKVKEEAPGHALRTF